MSQETPLPEIVVIYDGDCDFCRESVKWLQRKLTLTALPFQSADLARYNVTYDRCSKEVVAVKNEKIFGGAEAIALLLKARGNRILALLIMLSGPLGRAGYKWVASHRNGWVVQSATALLVRKNRTN